MPVYNGIINNFVQGVSEQDYTKRFEGQVAEQVNCLSDVTKGLVRRPGSQLLTNAHLAEGNIDSANYVYERGDGAEKYWITIKDGIFAVRNLNTGAPCTVDFGTTDRTYCTTSNPNDLRFNTIGDTTFILNRSKVVREWSTRSAPKLNNYLIYCKRATYGSDYVILGDPNINGGFIATYSTPSVVTIPPMLNTPDPETDKSTFMNKTIALKTTDVASALWVGLADNIIGKNGVTGDIYGDTIFISAPIGYNLNLEVVDSNHGNDLKILQHEISNYEDLPARGHNGYKVKVTGTDKTEFNDYYVEYVSEDGSAFGHGTWKEAVGWDLPLMFDNRTMPYKLVRIGVDLFALAPIFWNIREVGDEDSNPMTSFIGKTLSDITTYQNRLVLLSQDNLVASVTDEFYNFFSNTVVQTSDSDPIDSSSSDNQVTNFEHALIFNGNLVLFSDKAQFLHTPDS